MPYDEETLNRIGEYRLTEGSRTMATDGTIYATDAIRVLRDVVADIGPDTKRTCYYVKDVDDDANDGNGVGVLEPHCIVGVALNRLGVSIDTLIALDSRSADQIAAPLANWGVIKLDEQAADIFQAAQQSQDAGERWGIALSYAEGKYRDVSR